MHWTLDDVRDLSLDEYAVLIEELTRDGRDRDDADSDDD
jgi:hypothetical protein